MNTINRWLLPEGIEEMLPLQAERLESLRRELLDLYRSWGYQLVIPPFLDHLESLLTGTGHDLDLKTFKLVDQLSGRQLGLRADMTPQVARIDSHRLASDQPNRLCYLGTVLHARPEGLAASRSPMQVGAELFGNSSAESDVEILELMVATLSLAGVSDLYLDLGHVGVYRGLAQEAGLSAEQETILFDALQRKATPEIEGFLSELNGATVEQKARLSALATLNGDADVLTRAASILAGAGEGVQAALANLQAIATLASSRLSNVVIHFDLAELRGYQYQTGVVFAAFVSDRGQEIARGGRYDDIGKVFGKARPATGFSTDVRTLMQLSDRQWPERTQAILAPTDDDEKLAIAMTALRQRGEVVIKQLPGDAAASSKTNCDRMLKWDGSTWQVERIQ